MGGAIVPCGWWLCKRKAVLYQVCMGACVVHVCLPMCVSMLECVNARMYWCGVEKTVCHPSVMLLT